MVICFAVIVQFNSNTSHHMSHDLIINFMWLVIEFLEESFLHFTLKELFSHSENPELIDPTVY